MNNQEYAGMEPSAEDFDFFAMEDFPGYQPAVPSGAIAPAEVGSEPMNNHPSAINEATAGQSFYYQAEKKFPCQFQGCDRFFSSPHNVLQHGREAHTGEKPHACSICAELGVSKAFTRPASLYRHIRDVHKLNVDFARGKGVRRIVGPRRDPVPAAPMRAGRQQRQPRGRPMDGPEPQQSVYGALPDFPFQQQHVFQAVEDEDTMFTAPEPLPASTEVPVLDTNMPLPFLCVYDDCNTYLTALDYEAHGHQFHGMPPSATCGCLPCRAIFPHGRMQEQQPDLGTTLAYRQTREGRPVVQKPPDSDFIDLGFGFEPSADFEDFWSVEKFNEFIAADEALNGPAAYDTAGNW